MPQDWPSPGPAWASRPPGTCTGGDVLLMEALQGPRRPALPGGAVGPAFRKEGEGGGCLPALSYYKGLTPGRK